MSEPLPPSTRDDAYKPISGFALGGLVLSAGFAVLVLLSATVAVVKGAPIFYPSWLLLAPIVGFALCLVGRNQIVGSDGTRAGLGLAKWGLALALFSGLGYAAYFITVGYAVQKQANDFVVGDPEPDSGFLTHLARGGKNPADIDIAFLLTRPATGRIKIRPGETEALRTTYDQAGIDAGAGELTRFRDRLLVRVLARAGDRAIVEPLGVQNWTYDKGSYKVSRNYRVGTPEVVLDMILQAESTEAEAEGQLRQWFVNLNASPIQAKHWTPLGKIVDELREQSSRFLESKWRPRLSEGKAFPDFARSDKSDWKQLIPNAGEIPKGNKITQREFYQNRLKGVFAGQSKQPWTLHHDQNAWPLWGIDEKGCFWIDHPIRFMLDGGGDLLPMWAEGFLRVRSKEPFDPSQATPPAPALDWDVDEVSVLRVRATKGAPQ